MNSEILGSTIELLSSAKNADEAFFIFAKAVAQYGFDRVSYTLCTDHISLGLPKKHGLSTSYPEDWMHFYQEKKYMNVDPVVDAVFKTRVPFFWDHVTNKFDKNTPQYKLMKEAEDAGLAEGICIPVSNGLDELTGIGVARSKSINANDYKVMAEINLLSMFFHETFRGLIQKPTAIFLSEKEKDVLSWAAEGKVDDDIALLMDISFHTVRFHWKNIFNKLSVFNKMQAVAKAIRLHLITPGRVTY